MKLSEAWTLSPIGKLVPHISKWDFENKGLSITEIETLGCELIDLNPSFCFESSDDLKYKLTTNHLIAYDSESGLWFVCVRMPKGNYPEGYESRAKLDRKARNARYSFEQRQFDKKMKDRYRQAKGFEYWNELSISDFNKWKKENGFVFVPGVNAEKYIDETPDKKSRFASKRKRSDSL